MATPQTVPTTTFNQYYSSSDCTVFIEHPQGKCVPVLLDRLAGIGWAESLNSQPVYGIGNSKFGFLSQGNLLVNGVLNINFVHENYLLQTLTYIINGGQTVDTTPTNPLTLQQVSQMTDSQFSNLAPTQTPTPPKYTNNILIYPQNFQIRVVLNNSFLYSTDQNKEFVIKGIKINGVNSFQASSDNDEGLVMQYQFLAREVSTKAN